MSRRDPLPDAAAFDPTPAEAAAVERARPAKAPRCLRCKAGGRALPAEAAPHVRAALQRVRALLVDPRAVRLDRDALARLQGAHGQLVRVVRGRHCRVCVGTVVGYVEDIIDGLDRLLGVSDPA